MKSSSNHLSLDGFTAALIDGLKAELYLTPKPGLVDLSNNGAHPDLTLALMSRSIVMLRSYLKELSAALTRSAQYPELVLIGQQAETRMVRELGSNCHRGGIFLCGLLLVSATRIEQLDRVSLRQAVALTAADFFASKDGCDSHGNRVREQFPHAGIVDEALRGLPAVFEIVLPTVLDNGIDKAQGIYLAMAKLMQQVEDSTSLYRCGEAGLIHLRKSGEILEACILAGSDPVPLLTGMDRDFRRMNLTMGGVADLLGVGLGCASYLSEWR